MVSSTDTSCTEATVKLARLMRNFEEFRGAYAHKHMIIINQLDRSINQNA